MADPRQNIEPDYTKPQIRWNNDRHTVYNYNTGKNEVVVEDNMEAVIITKSYLKLKIGDCFKFPDIMDSSKHVIGKVVAFRKSGENGPPLGIFFLTWKDDIKQWGQQEEFLVRTAEQKNGLKDINLLTDCPSQGGGSRKKRKLRKTRRHSTRRHSTRR